MQYKIPTFDAAMKIVLILGAGMVVKPMVHHLLDHQK